MLSVRATAAGAVVVASLCFLAAPASACDERFIKKCERSSASAAAAAEARAAAPAAKRKSAGRVQVVISRRSKHMPLVKRTRAPGFAVNRERGMTLASGASRMTSLLPESALARRFRGFIDPLPMAQNAFETLRKPHLAAVNLEPAVTLAPAESAPPPVTAEPAEAAPVSPAVNIVTTAKQDRIAAKPAVTAAKSAVMELAAAESRPVALAESVAPAKPVALAAAEMAPAPAQAFFTAAPPPPSDEQPNRFSIHQLVLALCGALGAASALRFIVGA